MPTLSSRGWTVLRWVAAGVAVTLALLAAAAIAFLPSDDAIRRRLQQTLSDRFDAEVSLAELHVSLLPGRGSRAPA